MAHIDSRHEFILRDLAAVCGDAMTNSVRFDLAGELGMLEHRGLIEIKRQDGMPPLVKITDKGREAVSQSGAGIEGMLMRAEEFVKKDKPTGFATWGGIRIVEDKNVLPGHMVICNSDGEVLDVRKLYD